MEINIRQKTVIEVSDNGKIILESIVNNDCPLGILHDAELLTKSWTVDRMIANQKQEQEVADAQKAQSCCTGAE